MRLLRARRRVVERLAFDRGGGRLFSAGGDQASFPEFPGIRGIDAWDLDGGADPAEILLADRPVAGFALNPAGRWLYLAAGHEPPADPPYLAVDLSSGAASPLGLVSWFGCALDVHPSGAWLVGAGYEREGRTYRLIRWRQPSDGPPAAEWDLTVPYMHGVACDPGGSRVITLEAVREAASDAGWPVWVFVYELTDRDPGTGQVRGVVRVPARQSGGLLFSPDGAWLVLVTGASLRVWDARDLSRPPRTIRGDGRKHFTGMAFHPSGRSLAATSNDRAVRFYDVDTWQVAATYTWEIGRMRSIAFSPDGTLAAAGSDTGQIVLWDVDA